MKAVELLNEFEPEDVIVVDRDDNGSNFKRLDIDELDIWLREDYALGELWKKIFWEVGSQNEKCVYILRRTVGRNVY